MMRALLWIVFLLLICSGGNGRAQQSLAEAMRMHPSPKSDVEAAPAPPPSVEDALRAMFSAADVVFMGTVVRVERRPGAVLVQFHVDDAICGTQAGATYMLREWDGLWADDPNRYAQGERRLMFLHAASAAGYASPVERQLGSVHVRGTSVQAVVDLRWLATEVAVTAQRPGVRPLTSGDNRSAAWHDNGSVDGIVIHDLLSAWRREQAAQ